MVEVDLIMSFYKNILRHLENEIKEEYERNQHHVGVKELFCRCAVIDWLEANFKCKKYKILNKILVKHCVKFYDEC